MLLRVEGHKVVVFHHESFVIHFLEERKTVVAVFIVPQLGVNDRFVVADDTLAAFEDEVFEIFHIDFDRLDRFAVEYIVEEIHFHFHFNAFVHFRNAFVFYVAQALEKYIVALRKDHFHGFLLLAEGNRVNADVFQLEFGSDPFQDGNILRDWFKSMYKRIREIFRQVVGHHPDIGADVENDPVFVLDEIDKMEKILLLRVGA